MNFSFSAWVILWHTNALRNRRVILTCSFLPPICAKSIAVQLNIHFQRMYWLKLIFGIENVIAAFNNRHLILIIWGDVSLDKVKKSICMAFTTLSSMHSLCQVEESSFQKEQIEMLSYVNPLNATSQVLEDGKGCSRQTDAWILKKSLTKEGTTWLDLDSLTMNCR